MTFKILDTDRDEYNKKLDGWYNLGVNIIPMNTKFNIPVIDEWIPWQHKRIPPELYEYWKKEHLFDKGAAVILGRAWGKEPLVGKENDPVQYYLWCIDCDSNGAFDEIGILDNIKKECIVEYHNSTIKDELGRGHIFGFSTYQLRDKRLVDGNLIIEVFGESKHLMNVSPSIHKNGFPWERPENCTTIPSVGDNIANYMDKIFRKHGQEYLDGSGNGNGNGNGNTNRPTRIGKAKITIGNRHVELRNLICSLISKNGNGFDKELLRKFAYGINETECETPLPEKEINELFESCWTFIENNRKEQGTGGNNGSAAAQARPTAITGKVALLVQDASEDIMEKYSFLTIEETDEVLVYDKGVYRSGGKTLIAKELEAVYGYELNTHSLSQITGHIMRRSYHKHKELDSDINIINLKNGLYDIENNVLLPHNPEYLSVKQKPITYDKDAKSELFRKYISEWVYEQDIQTAIDIIAYTFRRDYDIEVLFKLYGYGNNGKSVYTSLISALHGPESISNVPLSEMLGSNKDKFASSDLEGKDVNIDIELVGQTIKETAILKRLTGGSRQPVRIQRKNERAYDTILWAKLIFNVNKMPSSTDTSDAYNRRLIILAFPFRFEGAAEDKQLTQKLTTDRELSGIFNVLMEALRRIVKTKEICVNEKTIEERRAKYERTVNTLQSFYDEMVSEYSEPEHQIPKEEFHAEYVKYCQNNAIPHEKYDLFCKNVKNKLQLKESKPEIKGKRVNCWKGVLWKGQEKLYDCPKCEYRNTDASAITIHVRQYHPQPQTQGY